MFSRRRMQQGCSVRRITGVDPGVMFQQQRHHGLLALAGCEHQRRDLLGICPVYGRTVFDKQTDRGRIFLFDGHQQWRHVTLPVNDLQVGTPADEQLRRGVVALRKCKQQRGGPGIVCDVYPGTLVDQCRRDFRAAAHDRPVQRRHALQVSLVRFAGLRQQYLDGLQMTAHGSQH